MVKKVSITTELLTFVVSFFAHTCAIVVVYMMGGEQLIRFFAPAVRSHQHKNESVSRVVFPNY